MADLLEVRGLVKSYGRRRVVDGVTFRVNRGEIVGLLGPNGAGKTTSFRMTCGMIPPEAGEVVLDGMNVTRWQRARLLYYWTNPLQELTQKPFRTSKTFFVI